MPFHPHRRTAPLDFPAAALLLLINGGMTNYRYGAIGPDRPLGDRDDGDEDWSPEDIERVSNEEVKNPADGPEIKAPDDPASN